MISKIIQPLLSLAIAFCLSNIAGAQTLTQYVKQKQKAVAEMQKVEKQKYELVCRKGTLEAFKEYAKAYPNGIYIDDINKRIEDFDLWAKAFSENTISAYNRYLQKSKHKKFQAKAEAAIKELQAKEEWQSLKTSKSISDITRFISTYPNSSCITEARKRMHELTAVDMFNKNQLLNALSEFNNAGGRSAIEYSNRSLYDRCEEYYEYSKLSSSSKEAELELFLNKYPNSLYFKDVSNKLAMEKVKKASRFQSKYFFKQALSYAKDDYTRTFVKSYYKETKRKHSSNTNISFYIELIDLGLNPSAYSNSETYIDYVMYYNMGLGVRLGNYNSPLQFEIGIKEGVTYYTLWNESDDENKTSFHMPIYARLKIGLGEGTYSNSRWYADCMFYYNAKKDPFLENDYSASIGVGLSWRHWDWRILYYKQDIGTQNTYSDYKFLGTSFGYYF